MLNFLLKEVYNMAKKNKANRSLTLVIIIMAIICVFIGYLVGINLFKWMKNGSTPRTQTDNYIVEESQQEDENRVIEEDNEQQQKATGIESDRNEDNINIDTDEMKVDYANFYKIQVGAFSNRANAESLKNELEDNGYSVIIKEVATFKVRVIGTESREETEKIQNELQEIGYETFIVK